MVQRPGDHHAVWHFWTGPDREFACWYINLQTAFVRTAIGYDTQDLELDIIVLPDGSWTLKDLDVLDDRVAEGRISRSSFDGSCPWVSNSPPTWTPAAGAGMTAGRNGGRKRDGTSHRHRPEGEWRTCSSQPAV